MRASIALMLAASVASAIASEHRDARVYDAPARSRIAALRETPRLRDAPPVGTGAAQYLDGEDWLVTSADGSVTIAGYVPGDLITDLQLGGVMGDPIYDQNWLTWQYDGKAAPLWDAQNWTYTKTFDTDAALLRAGTGVALTFDGVKMAADVVLNGVSLGTANDMFLRVAFDVAPLLRAHNNVLSVTFTTSDDPRNSAGRWPACSGGWDWAFYSQTSAKGANLRTFSKGIWRSVYLLPVNAGNAAITAVTPLVYYDGAYPTSPLTDGSNGPWHVDVRTFFSVAGTSPVQGMLSVSGSWLPSPISRALTLQPGETNATVTLSASNVLLWWPVGLGLQSRYDVSVTWTAAGGVAQQSANRTIGFRTGYLVTADDSAPATLAGVDGSGNLTYRWKVNGADIYARGGNIIPIDEMEGRFAAATYERIVDAAADAGMNALRVWGGGIYPPDVFYTRAAARGVLIRHDAMFAGDGRISPTGSALEEAELRQQVRRIASHPSVFSWDACNECGGGGLYASFVNTVMAEEDPSRPQWPSNPSDGWTSGVDRLTGLPNGRPLVAKVSATPPADAIAPSVTTPVSLAPPHGCPMSQAGCTIQVNVDYDIDGPIKQIVSVGSPAECCASCSAGGISVCPFAVYFSGYCYWKFANATKASVWREGRVVVWPPGSGPIPPSPPATGDGHIEAHGPYQHGGGFPAVNGYPSDGAFTANIPPTLAGPFTAYGVRVPGIFYSEFGASAWSSFESVAPTLPPAHWALHGGAPANPAATCKAGFSGICPGANPLAQRNYPADSFLLTYFPNVVPTLNTTGTSSFQRQLYLSVLAHGIEMKSDVTGRRSNAHWGTIWWQLNEIWPSGGWGSIEYGTIGFTEGQVVGGRWKAIQHFAASFLLRDVFIGCGIFSGSAGCFARNDDPMHALDAVATVTLVRISGAGSTVTSNTTRVTLPRGAAAVTWWCLGSGDILSSTCEALAPWLTRNGCDAEGRDCVLFTQLADAATGVVMSSSWELLGSPGSLALVNDPGLRWEVANAANADASVNVTVTAASAPAGFVTLTTLAQGRFSENVFWLKAAGEARTVSFIPFGDLDVDLLTTSLRVEHLAAYL